MRGELGQEWEGAYPSWKQHDKGVPLLTPSFPFMAWESGIGFQDTPQPLDPCPEPH